MTSLPLDVRHAFRSLAKSPAFTAVAIASLAIPVLSGRDFTQADLDTSRRAAGISPMEALRNE